VLVNETLDESFSARAQHLKEERDIHVPVTHARR